MGNVITSNQFILLQTLIEERFGIFLGEEKTYLLDNKLAKILSKSKLKSFEEFYTQISYTNDSKLLDDIIDAITVNETFWFRDKTPWLIMEDILLPYYINELRERKRDIIRIWSGACSYGQEPYSIAMCINSYLRCHNIQDINISHFQILATDISRTVIQSAQRGVYDNVSVQRGLDDANRLEYFKNEGKIWSINDRIKNAVRFQQLNLIKESPCNEFDIIFLRNVLIYFSEKQKKELLFKIQDALRPEGILFIGSSELLDDHKQFFSMLHHKDGIYFRLK